MLTDGYFFGPTCTCSLNGGIIVIVETHYSMSKNGVI